MDLRGLGVSIGETGVIGCRVGVWRGFGDDLMVFAKGVGHGFDRCAACHGWVHGGVVASRVDRALWFFVAENVSIAFLFGRCCWVKLRLECVPEFCCLGGALGSGGAVGTARAGVGCAWAGFRELSPILGVRDGGMDV